MISRSLPRSAPWEKNKRGKKEINKEKNKDKKRRKKRKGVKKEQDECGRKQLQTSVQQGGGSRLSGWISHKKQKTMHQNVKSEKIQARATRQLAPRVEAVQGGDWAQ
jgi:hypothetical protein